jgi:hypothetical protein
MKNSFIKTSLLAIGIIMSATPLMTCTPVVAEDAAITIEQFEQEVDSLPDDPNQLTIEQKQKVSNLMVEYQKFSMADKLSIKNYSKLETLANVKNETATGEHKSIAEQLEEQQKSNQKSNKPTTNTTAQADSQTTKDSDAAILAKATEYTLEYDALKPVSLIVRFVTDEDGDGKTDVPSRIVLLAPNGDSLPISKASVVMKDKATSLNATLTWTDNYLQIDFATAMDGKWSVQTSIPVTFTKKDYAGSKEDIVAQEDQKENNNQKTEQSQKSTAEEDDGAPLPIGGLTLIAVVIAGLFGFTRWNSSKAGKTSGNKPGRVQEEPIDDDSEYGYVDESEELEDDFLDEYNVNKEESINMNNISVPSLNTNISYDDPTPESIDIDDKPAIYSEGETSLLTGKMNNNKIQEEDDDID